MHDFNKSATEDSINEGKRFSLENKINLAQELILERYKVLVLINSIAFVVVGILVVNSAIIQTIYLAYSSFVILLLVALISLGRYLWQLRADIHGLYHEIMKLPEEDWTKPLERDEFKLDYWPEFLYAFLVIGVLLFILSLL